MLEVKQYVCGLRLKFISVERKTRERDNPRNIAQTSGYGKERVTHTNLTNLGLRKRPHRLYFLAGDPFFQLQAVALALLRVVRLAAGFLVRLGVVVGAAEAGCMGLPRTSPIMLLPCHEIVEARRLPPPHI